MPTWRDRLAASPSYWAEFACFLILFGGGTYLTNPDRSVERAVVSGLLFGVCMTIYVAVIRRKDRSAAGRQYRAHGAEIEHALRTGSSPSGANLDTALRGLINHRQPRLKKEMKTGPWSFGAFAALALVLAISGAEPLWLLYSVAFVGFGFTNQRSAARRLASLERLTIELDQRQVA